MSLQCHRLTAEVTAAGLRSSMYRQPHYQDLALWLHLTDSRAGSPRSSGEIPSGQFDPLVKDDVFL